MTPQANLSALQIENVVLWSCVYLQTIQPSHSLFSEEYNCVGCNKSVAVIAIV